MNTSTIPYNVRYVSTLGLDRLYRVYVTNEAIYFIQIDGQGGIGEGVASLFGLLGAYIYKQIKKKADKALMAKNAYYDQHDPEMLLSQHKNNCKILALDISTSIIDPPSTLKAHGTHMGKWTLDFTNGEKWHMQFEQMEHMHTALQVLPALLGDRCTVQVVWDQIQQRYIKAPQVASMAAC